jgi:hypothetical protein
MMIKCDGLVQMKVLTQTFTTHVLPELEGELTVEEWEKFSEFPTNFPSKTVGHNGIVFLYFQTTKMTANVFVLKMTLGMDTSLIYPRTFYSTQGSLNIPMLPRAIEKRIMDKMGFCTKSQEESANGGNSDGAGS